MNVFTGMAVDEFRRTENLRRRLVKAEDATTKAARRIPSEEFDLYVLATEVIRFELDRKDAEAAHDHEAAAACDRLLVEYRAKLADLEARVAAAQATAEREDRPVTLEGAK